MFSVRLKELRKKMNRTQEQVAQSVGITRPAYTAYESGKRQPDFEMLKKLAEYFDVTTDYLLGKSETKSEKPNENAMLIAAHIEDDATEEDMAKILDYIEMIRKSKNK